MRFKRAPILRWYKYKFIKFFTFKGHYITWTWGLSSNCNPYESCNGDLKYSYKNPGNYHRAPSVFRRHSCSSCWSTNICVRLMQEAKALSSSHSLFLSKKAHKYSYTCAYYYKHTCFHLLPTLERRPVFHSHGNICIWYLIIIFQKCVSIKIMVTFVID